MAKSPQVSISSTSYKQLFHMKVFHAAFLYLQFVFVIFCPNEIFAKGNHKLLVNFARGVNFINIK